MKSFIPIVSFFLLLVACADEGSPDILQGDAQKENPFRNQFEQLQPSAIGIDFINQIHENEEVNHLMWDAVYYGGGCAIGDINNDGLQDLFFSGNQVHDGLFLNKGNFQFENITEKSGILAFPGWSNGANIVDVNGDGLKDIYVCRTGWLKDNEMVKDRRNKLFINNGDLTFSEKSEFYRLDNEGYSTQSTWFDYDKDGDLDMFLLNAPSNNIPQKIEYNKDGFPDFCADKLFRNDGDIFVEVGAAAGVKAFSYGLGVIATDLNHDGRTDLYIANDYERPDYLYINNGDGTFTNQINEKIKHTSYTAMGVDAADINNDCLIDLAVLDMQSEDHIRSKTNMPTMNPEQFWAWVRQGYNHQYMTNVLQLNHGLGFFSEIAQLAGIASTDWSWSVLLADLDMDGWQDMYVTNGINRDIRNNDFALDFEEKIANKEAIDLFDFASEAPSNRISNYMFTNNGDLVFNNTTQAWGLDEASFSYGAAYADLDNDGDLDLVVNNNNMPPFIYKNTNAGNNNYLNVSLHGGVGNMDGLGGKVIIFYGDEKAYREITNAKGYQSCSQTIAHFGLGSVTSVDSLLVFFPNGTNLKQFNVKANQHLSFSEDQGGILAYDVYGAFPRYFQDVTKLVNVDVRHVENEFDDYQEEILLPHRESRNGPFVAVGDVNGDGLDDFYSGAAAGYKGSLQVQSSSSQFSARGGEFEEDDEYEDQGIVFFDVDADGDLDMYVASGGNHLPPGDRGYLDRLYINDGKGNFSRSSLPLLYANSSVVVASDVDGDGDIDLFIGGHCLPRHYPQADRSVLLINENGKLVDKTAELAPELLAPGMVNDAVFSDIDGDGDDDLLLVGEWMSPTFYLNEGGSFSLAPANEEISNLTGWWFSVSQADVDADGDMDFVVGNIGLNNKFHPSPEKPLLVYGNDFDGNETNDIVLAKMSGGEYVPVRGRECSAEQVPFVSEKFPNFEGYAGASLQEIYGEGLGSATKYDAKDFRSGVLINQSGSFDFVPFPNLAQISPIMGSVCADFNHDGHADIVIAGNHFDAEVETTRHDSGNGLVLLGDGSGKFEPMGVLYSGFYAPTNVKCLEPIKLAASGKEAVLVGSNNNVLTVFSYAK